MSASHSNYVQHSVCSYLRKESWLQEVFVILKCFRFYWDFNTFSGFSSKYMTTNRLCTFKIFVSHEFVILFLWFRVLSICTPSVRIFVAYFYWRLQPGEVEKLIFFNSRIKNLLWLLTVEKKSTVAFTSRISGDCTTLLGKRPEPEFLDFRAWRNFYPRKTSILQLKKLFSELFKTWFSPKSRFGT